MLNPSLLGDTTVLFKKAYGDFETFAFAVEANKKDSIQSWLEYVANTPLP